MGRIISGPRRAYQKYDRIDGKIRTVEGEHVLTVKVRQVEPHLPDFAGKTVLDVGTHSGFWPLYVAERGASYVLGIDRHAIKLSAPIVKREGQKVEFMEVALGPGHWPELRKFDFVFMMAVYHWLFKYTRFSHEPIWRWLATVVGGEMLAEIATSLKDGTTRNLVPRGLEKRYSRELILAEAAKYFAIEELGIGSEQYRELFRMVPRGDTLAG